MKLRCASLHQGVVVTGLLLLQSQWVGAFVPSTAIPLAGVEKRDTSRIESSDGSKQTVDFPPPLSNLDRVKRAATFWSSAVPIVASYYGKYAEMKVKEEVLGQKMSEEDLE
eukprot:scaffold551481_cov63-Attheya_sp.AAC.1